MTESHAKTGYLELLFLLASVAYGCWLAYHQVFFEFRSYDDEGYMIISLSHYLKQGGLYTKTFTQYGPFYFYSQQILHALFNLPISHDGGRIITLMYWIGSAATAGFLVYRLTRQALLSSVGFLGSLLVAIVLKHEPGHPQEVVLLWTEVGLTLSVFVGMKRSRWLPLAIGVAGSFIVLTKINAGIFFLTAAYFSCVSLMQRSTLRRFLFWGGSAFAIVLPAALMRQYLSSWAQHYCELATASIALFLITAWGLKSEDPWRLKDLIVALCGVVAGAVLILGFAVAQGISPYSLLQGIILSPLKHPGVFYYPLRIFRWWMVAAAVLFLVVAAVWYFRDRLEAYSNLLALIKILIGVSTVLTLVLDVHGAMIFVLTSAPLLYLRMNQPIEAKADGLEQLFPRVLLSAMIVFQFLQAYPVAGSQLSISFTPAIAWACVLIHDGFIDMVLGEATRLNRIVLLLRNPAAGGVLALCLYGAVAIEAYTYIEDRDPGPTLNLPGARRLHVSVADALVYGQLVAQIRDRCDVLFTMPGMYSLNLWSAVPTPNGLTLTAWMTAFTSEEQDQIVEILESHARPCIVSNPDLVRSWMPGGAGPLNNSAIARYVKTKTRVVATIANYQVMVPLTQIDSRIPRTP